MPNHSPYSRPFDLAIIGAGLFGLSAAWAAVRSGLRVVILTEGALGHGASWGLVGALAPYGPENPGPKVHYQFQAFQEAPSFWGEIEAISGMNTGFQQLGRMQKITSQRMLELAHLRADAAKTTWQEKASLWVETDRPHPFHAAPLGIIMDDLTGQITPVLAMQALIKTLELSKVEIREDAKVENPEDLFSFADRVLIAAGYESWPFVRPYLGARFGCGIKGQAALLEVSHPWTYPVISADGLYIVPHTKHTLAVGSVSENYFTHRNTDAALDHVITRAQSLCPELKAAHVIDKRAGIRPRASRPDPLAGALTDRIWIFSGGYKTGYAFAPKLAQDLISLMQGTGQFFPESFLPGYKLPNFNPIRQGMDQQKN